ncbi:MAG TPA: hypothetical protein DCM86_15585 [Verrucomicrobiales bacterium]|jgi:outer membrane murein-binding lipoprotein Lpp|nr:hypothetical protein [Verrucomicrobiales bacterium]
MSTSISTLSPSTSNPPLGRAENHSGGRQLFKDLKALRSALKAGDIDAAKAAYDKLQKDIAASAKSGGTPKIDPNSQAAKDLAAIGTALESKDIQAAQNAFASFGKDLRAQGPGGTGGPHRTHRHADNDGDEDDKAGPPAAAGGSPTVGANLDVQA